MLEVAGLRAGYGRIPILAGISFAVDRREVVGILGHNGMGKTTLLRALMGELPAAAGSIHFAGRDVTRTSIASRARAGIGYVPQGQGVFPQLTVRENLRMGELGQNAPRLTAELLEHFPILKPLLDRPASTLSGGERQVLSLARCLAGRPHLVLLDEPSDGVQPSIVEDIVERLHALLVVWDLTILLVEQDLQMIAELATRVLIMQKGRITAEVAPPLSPTRRWSRNIWASKNKSARLTASANPRSARRHGRRGSSVASSKWRPTSIMPIGQPVHLPAGHRERRMAADVERAGILLHVERGIDIVLARAVRRRDLGGGKRDCRHGHEIVGGEHVVIGLAQEDTQVLSLGMIAVVIVPVHVLAENEDELDGFRDVVRPRLPAAGEGLLQRRAVIAVPIVAHRVALDHHFGGAFEDDAGPDMRAVIMHRHRNLLDGGAEGLELGDGGTDLLVGGRGSLVGWAKPSFMTAIFMPFTPLPSAPM